MPEQQSLPLSDLAHANDPITAHVAGHHAAECFVGHHEVRILTVLKSGPMDAYQIGRATHLTNVQVSRRMAALRQKNLVIEIDGAGRSPTGGPLVRYQLTEKGLS